MITLKRPAAVDACRTLPVVSSGPVAPPGAGGGVPDDRLGERGCAFITLQAGGKLALNEMIRYLDEKGTAKQYWPEFLKIIKEMPRTPSGKVQKFKLREMAKSLARNPA